MNNNKKINRLGIDARFYGPVGKGLGRYTQEIVDNIIKLDQANQYVIFLSRENYNSFPGANNRIKKVLADFKWYGLAEQILFPLFIWRQRLNLMHFPNFNVPLFSPVKFVVTIHDLILIKFPTQRATTLAPVIYKIKNFFYKIVITMAVKRARRVLAVSEYTKQEVTKQFKIKPGKVIVTYEGVADFLGREISQTKPQDILIKYYITKSYLLYVGNAYPHKNLEGLIKVFKEINQENENLKLVLVGKEDYFYRRLKSQSGNSSEVVIFPGYVPDSDLKVLYSQALAYVCPSFYEGFGLPALEAMAFGLPVISSNKTCLPEILGQAAIYFNPENKREMKEKIELVIKDENLRRQMAARGFEQVKTYSWRDCAEKTLGVYRDVL